MVELREIHTFWHILWKDKLKAVKWYIKRSFNSLYYKKKNIKKFIKSFVNIKKYIIFVMSIKKKGGVWKHEERLDYNLSNDNNSWTATFGKEYEKKEALRLAKRLRTMAKKLLSK